MASDAARQPLMSRFVDPTTPQDTKIKLSKGRKLRRTRSDPLHNGDTNITTDLPPPRPASVFSNLHPNFREVILLLALYLGIGAVCFYLVRNQLVGKKTNGVLDAVYFCVVTMTTVGYGDLVPNSSTTRLLACAFVFTGMVLVGHILSKAADYLVEKQEILLVKALHISRKVGEAEIGKEIEVNKTRYKCIMTFIFLVVLITSGTLFLVIIEKLELIDAFYCVCSTITTLGYGDESFKSVVGRLFAVFWILTSTICLGQFFLYFAELQTENRQKALVKWVLTRKTTITDLEAADLDGDHVVEAAEFVIYKLKEMGKISEEDISLVMDEFEKLDVDDSGYLTNSDILLGESF